MHLAGNKIDTEEPGNLFGLMYSCYRPVKQPSIPRREYFEQYEPTKVVSKEGFSLGDKTKEFKKKNNLDF